MQVMEKKRTNNGPLKESADKHSIYTRARISMALDLEMGGVMGRSLFGKLHRRFGTRLAGAERTRRAAEHHVRLRSAIPLDVLNASPSRGPSPGKVAIIG